MTSVSTIVPTLSEELHIGRLIRSVRELGPVFVLDAGSTDRTREIAEEEGATFVEHPWEGYAAQKNWALDNLDIETEWVLFLDADEWLTTSLRAEIRDTVAAPKFNGYYIPRAQVFLGRELRHAWWYPDYQLRLFRKGHARYEARLVHEHLVLDGEAGFLDNPTMHENLKGIDAFLERHIRYAGLEAEEMIRNKSGDVTGQRQGNFFGSWPERRRALKTNVWYRMPARPLVRFAWMYFLKRGFLDGKQGRLYCQLIAAHETMITAKLVELELRAAGDLEGRSE